MKKETEALYTCCAVCLEYLPDPNKPCSKDCKMAVMMPKYMGVLRSLEPAE